MATLSPAEAAALESKRAHRRGIVLDGTPPLAAPNALARGWTPDETWSQFERGTFSHLENIRLRWAAPDYFTFIPRKAAPMSFRRPNGEVVTPRHMFTDGGSIPRYLWSLSGLSPWGYAPAYLVHDWLFDLHHCGGSPYGFEATRDIMMESIKTLMEDGVCPRDDLAFHGIYLGISSFVARQIWDKADGGCPLPPDYEE